MEKTMTLNLRVSPTVKSEAEAVLKQLGVPMATAIDIYLRKIIMTKSIPFSIELPPAPQQINTDYMTTEQIHAAIIDGYHDMENGNIIDAQEAFAKFREQHK